MPPLWVIETAEQFWDLAGEVEPFPRHLQTPIAYALPLTVIRLPRLGVRAVDDWLRRQCLAGPVAAEDRALHGGLFARAGHGFIFLDETDPPDEQRFSLAHELAHYLRDYRQPRQRLSEQLGSAALAVIDGTRPARPEERVHAFLAHASLSLHLHLMERTSEGEYRTDETDRAERDADWLAYELLAPSAPVEEDLRAYPPAERSARCSEILIARYGLPRRHAAAYAALLFPSVSRPIPFLQCLESHR